VVPSVVHGDGDQKGAQGRLETVATHGARQGNEHFVQKIFGGSGVADQPRRERAHGPVMLIVHLPHRRRIGRGQASDQVVLVLRSVLKGCGGRKHEAADIHIATPDQTHHAHAGRGVGGLGGRLGLAI
jgi:hypothetical protein